MFSIHSLILSLLLSHTRSLHQVECSTTVHYIYDLTNKTSTFFIENLPQYVVKLNLLYQQHSPTPSIRFTTQSVKLEPHLTFRLCFSTLDPLFWTISWHPIRVVLHCSHRHLYLSDHLRFLLNILYPALSSLFLLRHPIVFKFGLIDSLTTLTSNLIL